MDAPNRESVVQRVGFRLTLLLKPPNSRNQWSATLVTNTAPWISDRANGFRCTAVKN